MRDITSDIYVQLLCKDYGYFTEKFTIQDRVMECRREANPKEYRAWYVTMCNLAGGPL